MVALAGFDERTCSPLTIHKRDELVCYRALLRRSAEYYQCCGFCTLLDSHPLTFTSFRFCFSSLSHLLLCEPHQARSAPPLIGRKSEGRFPLSSLQVRSAYVLSPPSSPSFVTPAGHHHYDDDHHMASSPRGSTPNEAAHAATLPMAVEEEEEGARGYAPDWEVKNPSTHSATRGTESVDTYATSRNESSYSSCGIATANAWQEEEHTVASQSCAAASPLRSLPDDVEAAVSPCMSGEDLPGSRLRSTTVRAITKEDPEEVLLNLPTMFTTAAGRPICIRDSRSISRGSAYWRLLFSPSGASWQPSEGHSPLSSTMPTEETAKSLTCTASEATCASPLPSNVDVEKGCALRADSVYEPPRDHLRSAMRFPWCTPRVASAQRAASCPERAHVLVNMPVADRGLSVEPEANNFSEELGGVAVNGGVGATLSGFTRANGSANAPPS